MGRKCERAARSTATTSSPSTTWPRPPERSQNTSLVPQKGHASSRCRSRIGAHGSRAGRRNRSYRCARRRRRTSQRRPPAKSPNARTSTTNAAANWFMSPPRRYSATAATMAMISSVGRITRAHSRSGMVHSSSIDATPVEVSELDIVAVEHIADTIERHWKCGPIGWSMPLIPRSRASARGGSRRSDEDDLHFDRAFSGGDDRHHRLGYGLDHSAALDQSASVSPATGIKLRHHRSRRAHEPGQSRDDEAYHQGAGATACHGPSVCRGPAQGQAIRPCWRTGSGRGAHGAYVHAAVARRRIRELDGVVVPDVPRPNRLVPLRRGPIVEDARRAERWMAA